MSLPTLSDHNAQRRAFWQEVRKPLIWAEVLCDDCGERMAFDDTTMSRATMPKDPVPIPVNCPACGAKGAIMR